MKAKLAYAIEFVADMDRAVAFYRDRFELKVRFATPEWTEFETGEVTLALHLAGPDKAAGSVQIGFEAPDLAEVWAARDQAGLAFAAPPVDEHGVLLARILDCEGAEVSLSTAAR